MPGFRHVAQTFIHSCGYRGADFISLVPIIICKYLGTKKSSQQVLDRKKHKKSIFREETILRRYENVMGGIFLVFAVISIILIIIQNTGHSRFLLPAQQQGLVERKLSKFTFWCRWQQKGNLHRQQRWSYLDIIFCFRRPRNIPPRGSQYDVHINFLYYLQYLE